MYQLTGRKLTDMGFTTPEGTYPPGWIAAATPEERAAIGIIEVPEPLRPDARLGDIIENQDGSFSVQPYPLADVIANCCTQLDNAVSVIYVNWTRFEAEYNKRLAAAQVYVTANYQGNADTYLTSFATSAAIPLNTAADTVIQQAGLFETALENLGALRMRKFEIKRCTTPTFALTLLDEILTKVAEIGSQLS